MLLLKLRTGAKHGGTMCHMPVKAAFRKIRQPE